MDAIALLEHDHREVEMLFRQFEKARSADRKSRLWVARPGGIDRKSAQRRRASGI